MKNVLILHGVGETPKSYWYPWLKQLLTEKGYEVDIPQLPNTDKPELEKQLEFVKNNCKIEPRTVIIGHSSGASLILAMLEKSPIVIKKAILVAGYFQALKVGAKDTANIKKNYNWKNIKKNSRQFVFINSDNDPWGADDKQGKKMFEKLGGLLIVNKEGHMGSDKFKQPYPEFPAIVKFID